MAVLDSYVVLYTYHTPTLQHLQESRAAEKQARQVTDRDVFMHMKKVHSPSVPPSLPQSFFPFPSFPPSLVRASLKELNFKTKALVLALSATQLMGDC